MAIFNSLLIGPLVIWMDFRQVTYKLNLVIDRCDIYCETVLRLMSLDVADDKSALAQLMAWCR